MAEAAKADNAHVSQILPHADRRPSLAPNKEDPLHRHFVDEVGRPIQVLLHSAHEIDSASEKSLVVEIALLVRLPKKNSEQ